MKSLKYRLKKHEVNITNTDWNKYDDRLMKAVERREVDKVAAVLGKKGIIPTKLDVEGRSAFHLAASRGHLDCLSLILSHGVDVTASDATGKNALHLAARNGQSLCVQKLLQHNCPVGNVDLQGRTALHDAVMAGCSSSVRLLCDSGASVNACDFDGRTPLVLATQMCHPHICQLLLDRGSDITVRDKRNKTALILGCEYACKDAVEVLLKNGADVAAVDSFGHDSYHYARLGKNPELVCLIKSYLDSATKAKEAARREQKQRRLSAVEVLSETSNHEKIIQDMEQHFHQEQRTLLDKVSNLQRQLNQEKSTVEDIHKERDQLKLLLSVREKEDGVRAAETVRVHKQNSLSDYPGQSVIKGKEHILVRQSYSLDSAQMVPSRLVAQPLEPSLPVDKDPETLREEVQCVHKQQEAAQQEVGHLQMALANKSKECEELTRRCMTIKQESDQQICEMEEAMRDVQKRMLDSEAKMKQLQAHVLAVKGHFNYQSVDELKAELNEVKTKYEGASSEVEQVRNHLKQSEKALEEYKKSGGQLTLEVEKLTAELSAMQEKRKNMEKTILNMESQVKTAEVKLTSMVPAERFDNMKNLLTNAVDEKDLQLVKLREDYEHALKEVAELHCTMDNQNAAPLQEHERVRASLEEQSLVLKNKLADVDMKYQSVILDLKKSEDDKDLLRKELQVLNDSLKTKYVTLENHEEVKRSMVLSVEELKVRLKEETEKNKQAEEQMHKLQEEKLKLGENISHLRSTYIPCEQYESEMAKVLARNTELERDLKSNCDQYQKKVSEFEIMAAENASLKESFDVEFVTKSENQRIQTELGDSLEKAKIEIAKLEEECRTRDEELQKVKEEHGMLKEEFGDVQAKLEKDYISLVEHEMLKSTMSNALSEADRRTEDAYSMYQSAQERASKLHEEIKAQKKELDTIQEAFQSKYVSLTAMEEKELKFNTALKDLTEKLAKMQELYDNEKTKGESQREENEKLKDEMSCLQQKLQAELVSSEKYKDVEHRFRIQVEELSLKLVELDKQYKEVTIQRAELEEQNALCNTEIQGLQKRLNGEFIHLEKFEAMQSSLNRSLQEARQESEHLREAHKLEVQRVHELEKQLLSRSCDDSLKSQYNHAMEVLEREVHELRLALREEEETSAQRAEDVATLQTDLLKATHALEDLRSHEEQVTELRAEKHRLEREVQELGNRIVGLDEQREGLCRETAQARESEKRVRAETEALQVKSTSLEKDIRELKEKYSVSLNTIEELQKKTQVSTEETELKDKRITELLADVESLKQALNGLSQLAYAGNTPSKRQTQHIDTLQAQVKSLQQQLADSERQHREVVSIYRTHLLSAAQGHMDEDVQAALLQIIRMRKGFVC